MCEKRIVQSYFDIQQSTQFGTIFVKTGTISGKSRAIYCKIFGIFRDHFGIFRDHFRFPHSDFPVQLWAKIEKDSLGILIAQIYLCAEEQLCLISDHQVHPVQYFQSWQSYTDKYRFCPSVVVQLTVSLTVYLLKTNFSEIRTFVHAINISVHTDPFHLLAGCGYIRVI